MQFSSKLTYLLKHYIISVKGKKTISAKIIMTSFPDVFKLFCWFSHPNFDLRTSSFMIFFLVNEFSRQNVGKVYIFSLSSEKPQKWSKQKHLKMCNRRTESTECGWIKTSSGPQGLLLYYIVCILYFYVVHPLKLYDVFPCEI